MNLKDAMTNNDKFAFLFSTRFWAYIIGFVTVAMGPDGVVTSPEVYNGLLGLVAAFAGTKTIDRAVDKLSEQKTPLIDGEI